MFQSKDIEWLKTETKCEEMDKVFYANSETKLELQYSY